LAIQIPSETIEVSMQGDQQAPPFSPEWWVYELSAQMDTRNRLIGLYEDYFAGRHKLTFASSQFREAFGQMLAAISDNWIPLVIGASVERLKPQGFRFGDDSQGDNDAWSIWQHNCLDDDAPLGYTEACKHGEAYYLVWPDEQPTGIFGSFFSRRSADAPARITLEHPAQMIVAREAGDRRRIAAALKRWVEHDGTIMATLYLPDQTYRFVIDGNGKAVERPGVESRSRNRLGRVPVVPIVNDPQMLGVLPPASLLYAPHLAPNVPIGLGRSDMADIVSTVDQINKLLCDMLVASEVSAFRQRWATGLEVPEDDNGEPVQPFSAAVDRLWIAPPDEDGESVAKFGEFSATDLSNYWKAMENRIQSLAARTRTPPHYLLGSIVNASGDALKAAETGLASKVNGKAGHFGESNEEAVRLAFAWKNDARARDISAETVWGPTESRSESEYVDSLVKKMALGVPKEQLWADAGYSPQQIGRFKTMLLEEGLREDIFAPPPQTPSDQVAPDAVSAG
jgi:hypothetical protein